jgi:hypothetical protein
LISISMTQRLQRQAHILVGGEPRPEPQRCKEKVVQVFRELAMATAP